MKPFTEYNKEVFSLNESTDDQTQDRLKEKDETIEHYSNIIDIYEEISGVGVGDIKELISNCKDWEVYLPDVIQQARFEQEDFGSENQDGDFFLYLANRFARRSAFHEEFENFDWGDLDLDQDDIVDEDDYETIQIDVSGDGSGDYEEACSRKDLRDIFKTVLVNRAEEELDWDEDEEEDED